MFDCIMDATITFYCQAQPETSAEFNSTIIWMDVEKQTTEH